MPIDAEISHTVSAEAFNAVEVESIEGGFLGPELFAAPVGDIAEESKDKLPQASGNLLFVVPREAEARHYPNRETVSKRIFMQEASAGSE
jgi:hypothetical protein